MNFEQEPDQKIGLEKAEASGFAVTSVPFANSRGLAIVNNLVTCAIAGLILITCAVGYIAFAPALPANTLDSGWQFGVNMAVAKGLVFGKNVIFTFGPYGSIYTRQYNPATDTMMLAGGALVASAVAFNLLYLCKGYARLIGLALALFLVSAGYDVQLFALPLLVIMFIYRVAMERRSSSIAATGLVKFTWVLTILALGILPVVKGTFAITAGIVMLLACWLLIRRHHAWIAAFTITLFLATLISFWVIAGQPVQFLPGYFLAQIPIVTGYTEAMSAAGPVSQVVVFIASCSLLWWLGNRRFAADGDAGVALAIGSALILFLGFKEGLVRADHFYVAGNMLGLGGLAFLVLKRTVPAAAGCIAGLAGLIAINNVGLDYKPFIDPITNQFHTAGVAIVSRIEHRDLLKAQYIASLDSIRDGQKIPDVSGPTDIYSYGQSLLLANDLEWDPRPVLQSYSAYTPALAAKDAGHLFGANAPANVFFTVQPIDMRLPSLDDGLSWPALLANYRFSGLYGDIALLQRRDRPAPLTISPLVSGTFKAGEPIKLPPNVPFVWAELEPNLTLVGKVFGILFKPPHLTITYGFPNGRQQSFRYIAGMGKGFLVAPLVQDTHQFIALSMPDASAYFAGEQPSYIRLQPGFGGGLFWHSRFGVKFAGMSIPVQPSVGKLLFTALNPLAPASPLPTTTSCSIDGINGRLITHRPVDVGGFMQVAGWAAVSSAPGVAAAQTAVTLTAPDGHEMSAVATQTARPDVARYFRQPALSKSGFDVEIDMTGLSGAYDLTVQPSVGGKTWSCSVPIPIRVVPFRSGPPVAGPAAGSQ